MKSMVFAARNTKEILRDPLNLSFGLGFPIILLLLLSAIQANIPVELFAIDQLVPGIAIFGLSFIALFAGTLIAKDRSTWFLIRLFASPMTAFDFIVGYTVPLLPMALAQSIICYIVAFILGLPVTVNVLVAVLASIPAAILFIGVGLLAGSVLNDKQVGGICGALLTNLTAWLSGTWFDIELVGGAFKSAANVLPFVHAVNAGRAAIDGNYTGILPQLWIVAVYAVVVFALAVTVFKCKMNSEKM